MKVIRIGEILKAAGVITEEQIEKAVKYQRENPNSKKRFGKILVELGFISEKQMIAALGQKMGYAVIDLNHTEIDVDAVSKIPKSIADKYNMIAIKIEDNNLTVALSDPLQFYGIEDVRQITQMQLTLVLDTESNISDAIETKYGTVNTRKALEKASSISKLAIESVEAVEDVGEDSPVVSALNQLLIHAYKMGASDVHIEPFENHLLVRVRVDGVMIELSRLDISLLFPIIARVKIMSEMDIAERRKPQDGHFVSKIEDFDINGRVSIIPTVHGEKAVIRFLFSEVLVDSHEYYGMTENNYKKFAKILASPYGMVYISGPTGSGKTTTLYMVLETMAKNPINISTIEDPVERNLDRTNQMQVNNLAGLTFERGLRALLRQDPDVIMVGETRDTETAEIAVRAAITGHLVFSTIHTNDALSIISRLGDMGLPSYMIANSLVGLVAQRLMRKTCPDCGEVYEATLDECNILGVEKATLKKGKGCVACNGTGYKGRLAIHEVVEVDKMLRHMIIENDSIDNMKKVLREKNKYSSLEEEAKKLVLDGVTTIEEYLKIAHNID